MDLDITKHDGHVTMTVDNYKRLMNRLDQYQQRILDLTDKNKLISDQYLNGWEAGRILKVSRRTIERYRDDGKIPEVRMGGKVFYRKSDLDLFLLRREDESFKKLLEKGKA